MHRICHICHQSRVAIETIGGHYICRSCWDIDRYGDWLPAMDIPKPTSKTFTTHCYYMYHGNYEEALEADEES
jgi:hypothetical protein